MGRICGRGGFVRDVFWHKSTEVPLQRERSPPKCRTHCINKKRGDASDDG